MHANGSPQKELAKEILLKLGTYFYFSFFLEDESCGWSHLLGLASIYFILCWLCFSRTLGSTYTYKYSI